MFHVKHPKIIIEEHPVGIGILKITRELQKNFNPLLERYLDELLSWNQKINLVSRTVSRETVREHITHSLLVQGLGLLSGHSTWLDTGSGGGLPGIPLSIINSNMNWVLNDNIRKKMMVIDSIIEELKLKNVRTETGSVSLVKLEPGTGIVSKHAFKTDDLIRKLEGKPWKTIILWKGVKDAREEVGKIRGEIKADLYRLEFGSAESFYEGKGILMLRRKG